MKPLDLENKPGVYRIIESLLTDPTEANIKSRVGLRIALAPELNVSDAVDAIKAIRDITTARQLGSQESSSTTGGATNINLYVTIAGGQLSPEVLQRKILSLDGVLSAYIKNVDGEKYLDLPQRKRQMRKNQANERL